jgi:hypothetical protein
MTFRIENVEVEGELWAFFLRALTLRADERLSHA